MDLSTAYKKPRRKKQTEEVIIGPEPILLTAEQVAELVSGAPYLCQKDKLAIVGTADPTRRQGPYTDDEFEIWGVGAVDTYPDVTRLDLFFEMHPESYWRTEPNIVKRLQETDHLVYMMDAHEDIPKSMRYPIETILKYRNYHTSTVSYMMALAYHGFVTTGKPKRVEFYGIHMAAKEEYTDQRPCCEYWAGCMDAAGMDIKMAEGGALLISNGLYGYENYNPVCWQLRQRLFRLQDGLTHANSEQHRWELQKNRNEAAIAEADHWLLRFQRGEFNNGRPDHGEQESTKESSTEEGSTGVFAGGSTGSG